MVHKIRRPLWVWVGGACLLMGSALPLGEISASGPPAHSERTLAREVEERGVAEVVVTLHPVVPGRGHSVKAIVDEVLRGAPPSEIEAVHRLESAPVFIARINGRGLKRLLADARVWGVDLDGEVRGTDEISAAQIGADRVQELGILGEGVTVAVLDSGTDILGNPDLDPALAGEECFCSGFFGGCCPDGTARQSGPGSAHTVTTHGPGVMGIIASRGVVAPPGIAPGSKILMVRVLDDTLVGTFSDILLALDWVVTHGDGVRVVNLSLAAGPFAAPCDHAGGFNEAVAQLSAAFRAKGGVFVAASGNDSSTDVMGSPACVTSVISVGAVDAADRVQSTSNGGESLDLLAPGDRIRTSSSFGRVQQFTGTSASAPHVSASAALLFSANPELSPDALEERFKERGVPILDPRSLLTTPRLDAFQALLLPIDVRSIPRALSQRSRGRGFTLVLQPRPPFLASDLDVLRLSATLGEGPEVPVDPAGATLGDNNGDGVEDLLVHLDRRLLLSGISGNGEFPIVVRGALQSGIEVRGSATLNIFGPAARGRAPEPAP